MASPFAWIAFGVLVLPALALDLGLLSRRPHAVSVREASLWTAAWVGLASIFGVGVFVVRGTEPGLAFVTAYLIELSLSADNVFLFVLLFSSFAVPAAHQHRVLFWGVLGAVAMRAVMIVGGAALLARFHWAIYVFGGVLVFTGVRMFLQRDKEPDPSNNRTVRWLRRVLPLTDEYRGARFLSREGGRLMATPLLLVLVLVELTDLVFAVDSIPAVFAVTTDPFIVFTSNVFAVLGLRSLYFLLAGVAGRFHYLKVGLSVILVLVGLKMLRLVPVSVVASLLLVATILAGSIAASLLRERAHRTAEGRREAEHA